MMPEEEAKQIKIESTTGVPREANLWDKVTATAGGGVGGLAVYIAFVLAPEQTLATKELAKAITSMQAENAAHYRAMSDDRRGQYDAINAKLTDAAHNISELRRTARSDAMKAGSHAPDKP